MKKWLLAFVLIFVIGVVCVYVYIPSKQFISSQVSVDCTQQATERILLDKQNLSFWWPGTISNGNALNYKDFRYLISNIQLNGISAFVSNGVGSIEGMIKIVPTNGQTILLQWVSPVSFSNNPFTRTKQYFNFVAYKKNIDNLFIEIKNHLEKPENIYGFKVVQQTVTDTLMVSVKQTFNHYPVTSEIYGMVNSLKQFISLNKGEENGFPMLNVHPVDSASFDVMVAIPTKTAIKSSNHFLFKKMIPGNILMAEIKGGIYTVMKGEEQMTNYANDHKKLSPAIPYQSLVTNRQLEQDTAKWVTRLFYPIFI